MKNIEKTSSRRKFMVMGASSAAVLFGGAALSSSAHAVKTLKPALTNENAITHINIDEMKTDQLLKIGDTVHTLGYHHAGDEGDNIYQIVANNMHSDDGGSYIHLTKTGLTAKAIFSDGIIRAEQFGIIGVNNANETNLADANTLAMTQAHQTGRVIHYGAKYYHFLTLTIAAGGIIGQGDKTVLMSADHSAKNIITYQGLAKTAFKSDNNTDGTFKNFLLTVNDNVNKEGGAGLKLAANTTKNNYNAQLSQLSIKNIPTSIYVNNEVSYCIKDCFIADYTSVGILIENNSNIMNEHHNTITYNTLITKQPFAKGIAYQGGYTNISHNKISGGEIGIEISPAYVPVVAIISKNTIEQQSLHAIGFKSDIDILGENKSQLIISQNSLNAATISGAAINITPTHYLLTDLSINNNMIRFGGDKNAIAAINIHNSTGFMINHNSINCEQGLGYRGVYIAQNCNSGMLSANNVVLPLNGHTLNLSITTKEV
ncbi:MAG: hypothetical protein JKX78_14950 [Alteromonadaceae bacterium]|nr:hypothetical protein [Alteromonadaceae bacterium]